MSISKYTQLPVHKLLIICVEWNGTENASGISALAGCNLQFWNTHDFWTVSHSFESIGFLTYGKDCGTLAYSTIY